MFKKGHVNSDRLIEKLRKIKTIHGYRDNPVWGLWQDIRRRCYNKNCCSYSRYGGRGITVCDEWFDAKTFCDWAINHGYRKGLQIDRIDNDKGYSPDNCRFVTPIQNSNNRRAQIKNNNYPTGIVRCNSGKYKARISMFDKRVHLGNWDTPEEASKQYECVKRIYQRILFK